jgi:hypothetical protein
MSTLFGGDVHAGIAGIELQEATFSLGHGLTLSKTYAHLMAPFLMAFKPAPRGQHHPAPWKSAQGGSSFDVNAELFIPGDIEDKFGSRIEVATTVLFLLRLGVNPAITLPVFANHAFNELANLKDNEALLFPYEVHPRHFPLGVVGGLATTDSLTWTAQRWPIAQRLINESAEFSLAVNAIDGGQFLRQSALILVSLWAAIEALFSPSTSELKFRVSSLVAAFLEPPGAARHELQRSVAKLYDKRSAAAHGKPKHEPDDLLATFNLLRRILMAIIDRGSVPSKDELEQSLFGIGARDAKPLG